MAKIYSPNKQYSGISASVVFIRGVGETETPTLLDWFRSHGYAVEDEEKKEPAKDSSSINEMDVDQLKAYAEDHKIDIGNSTSVNGILKKITDAEKATAKDPENKADKDEKQEV